MIYNLFEIPVYDINLEIDNEAIEKYCKQLEQSEQGVRKSNIGGYHSSLVSTNNKILNPLINKIEEHCNIFSKQCGLDKKQKLDDLWININRFKDFNQSHFHPTSLFSGVYYVKVPQSGGNIYFENPVGDLMDSCWSDKIKQSYTKINSSKYTLISNTSKLFLFPSWLKHGVYPNMDNKERISISFNLR